MECMGRKLQRKRFSVEDIVRATTKHMLSLHVENGCIRSNSTTTIVCQRDDVALLNGGNNAKSLDIKNNSLQGIFDCLVLPYEKIFALCLRKGAVVGTVLSGWIFNFSSSFADQEF